MHNEDKGEVIHDSEHQDSIIDQIKNYVFPAKKVLDKAAGKVTPAAPAPVNSDPGYLQKIVNQRMKEKVAVKNPLADEIAKCKPGMKNCK